MRSVCLGTRPLPIATLPARPPIREQDEQLILVDEADREIRADGKLSAHRNGALHRAFSVFVFRPNGDLVLQRRAATKYHSAGKWANSACGHPRPFEDTVKAGERRLAEELGLSCRLTPAFQARYEARFENGLVENEFVHVLFGVSDAPAAPDPNEASAVQAIDLATLAEQIAAEPGRFAVWLRHYFNRHLSEIMVHRDRMLSMTGTS